MQLLSLLLLSARRWQRYHNVRAELSAYGDRELADMGVRRSDIPAIARDAAAMIRPAADKAAHPHFATVAQSS